ncbi:MAG: hypothetical protein L3K26_18525, partial [Candidatus Hydrogenedentes bacterium]|nr:hypothetical protein [Candidatus Hydrogenedentota bacterium]
SKLPDIWGFRQAFLSLHLPIPPHLVEQKIGQAVEIATEQCGAPQDAAAWLNLHIRNWKTQEKCPPELANVICEALGSILRTTPKETTKLYLKPHATLIPGSFLSHEHASLYLSSALLVIDLAQQHGMSASQVSLVVASRTPQLDANWETAQAVLQTFGITPKIDTEFIVSLFEEEKILAEELYLDSTYDDILQSLEVLSEKLEVGADLPATLRALCPDGEHAFGPYLQMIHYQLSIVEKYDHPPSYLYEFTPRGTAVDALMRLYPSPLSEARNPFLNNAKAASRWNSDWAKSKKPHHRRQALAMAELFEALEPLAYPARRELAFWLRLWIQRIIIQNSRQPEKRLRTIPTALLSKLTGSLLQTPSETRGILEQRRVDALSVIMYPASDGWRPRGLGDSVNANNLSKKKLGDCDFQNARECAIVALEPHAGVLTASYVEEHIFSLTKVLKGQIPELEGIADIGNWKINVTFVAHSKV